ncbi:aminotransferase class V-fold PLP-dependent enzyme [Acetivibrio cellulolyticus]|uniref:aminotransferase class V-fold PLP-dependent enzyme n=1 Tax=Acetivibrio cellulolyticus TaxID=35830 RepID=UPI0001E2C1FD|nr:aminotransferase class V-fold PLP-dependent enzyme [Acetivibrio cellulolyticus]
MIYLDNAATSYPKPEKVYDEMLRCMKEYCANPGRGGHDLSIKSGRAVMEAREAIAEFFNIKDPMRLVFTKNATEALNIAIKGVLKKGDHVITTSMEHNSVIRPLKTLERDMGIELTIVSGNEFGEVDVEEFRNNIKSNTRMIVCTLSSNVNGIIMPIKDIGELTREKGIIFLVDASQGVGALEVDVEYMKIDLMAFPGHKALLGPQGTGGLYVANGIEIDSILQGGTGSSSENMFQPEILPDALESGTLNTPGIVGLSQGIGFINSFGLLNIKNFKNLLINQIYDGLSNINGVIIYSKKEPSKNSGIIAFNFKEIDSTEVSYVLDKGYGIASRAGLHCAPLAHQTMGTIKGGIVRLSVGCFNTQDEINMLLNALQEISDSMKYVTNIN